MYKCIYDITFFFKAEEKVNILRPSESNSVVCASLRITGLGKAYKTFGFSKVISVTFSVDTFLYYYKVISHGRAKQECFK